MKFIKDICIYIYAFLFVSTCSFLRAFRLISRKRFEKLVFGIDKNN